jgi:hypothetical protein
LAPHGFVKEFSVRSVDSQRVQLLDRLSDIVAKGGSRFLGKSFKHAPSGFSFLDLATHIALSGTG